MKKKKIIFSSIVLFSILGLSNVTYAAEYQPDGVSQNNTGNTGVLSGLDDSDSIVVLNDGSVIHGEVIISTVDNPDNKMLIDSDSDPLAVTVSEYKEDSSNIESKDLPVSKLRAASPPAYSVELKNRASYTSAYFSASGWRFAERYYYPQSGTGAYLRWETFNDSGRVGGINDTRLTYDYGILTGTPIYPGGYRYVEGFMTYYTYNPARYTYFKVSNY